MAMKIRVITQYFDEETGEVHFAHDAVGDYVPCDEFDFSSKEGILEPFETLEGNLLGTAQKSMCGATEQYMAALAESKKKQRRPAR